MAYKHGVYITESSTQLLTPLYSDAAIQVAIGTAPIHLLDNPEEAVNKPFLINSFNEAVAKVGYIDSFKYTLCEVIDASFRVFNVAPIILINVLDPKKHSTEKTDETVNIVDKKALIKQDGIILKSIILKSVDNSKVFTLETDFTVAFNADGYVEMQILPDGLAAEEKTLNVSYSFLDTEKVTENDIIGGYNTLNGEYSGLEAISRIYPKHNKVPGILICPGYSQNPNVYAVIKAKTEKVNGCFNLMNFVDVDSKTVKLYENVNEWKNKNGFNGNNTVLCWPKVKVGSKVYHMSTMAAALEAYTIAKNSGVPYVSPSNKDFRITGTILDDGTEVNLDQEQANVLNSQGVFTAINVNGWRSWGNETACYPANTDVKDRFIACRMMFNWWGASFIQTYFQEVDNPANLRLINRIVDTENIRANGFLSNEQIAGAKITYNTEEILNGTIKFKQYLAFYPPAADIENDLEFDTDALQNAVTGGNQ